MAKARGERPQPSTIHANADGVISPPSAQQMVLMLEKVEYRLKQVT
jgi:hypothetical protein